jgi:hypothetical protein
MYAPVNILIPYVYPPCSNTCTVWRARKYRRAFSAHAVGRPTTRVGAIRAHCTLSYLYTYRNEFEEKKMLYPRTRVVEVGKALRRRRPRWNVYARTRYWRISLSKSYARIRFTWLASCAVRFYRTRAAELFFGNRRRFGRKNIWFTL